MSVLGVRVHLLTAESLTARVRSILQQRSKSIVAYINVHGVNLAYQDPRLREFFDNATIVYCDGEGVRIGGRILGTRIPERITLTDWVWNFFSLCEQHGASVYFLGSTPEVVTAAAQRVRDRFPNLKLLGWHHGYFEKQGPESERIIEEINRLSPDILLVGFGMPIQEHFVIRYFDHLGVTIILTVGSCFDYISGKRRRAPRWMRLHGLEWLFRLLQEPTRLFKRYIIGNPLFILRTVNAAMTQRR